MIYSYDIGRNINAKDKTEPSTELFKESLNQKRVRLPPEYLDHDELSQHLCRFQIQLKKQDGSQYEPVTVRSIVGVSLDTSRTRSTMLILSSTMTSMICEKSSGASWRAHELYLGNRPKDSSLAY